eukprot:SAG31_NODE_886_length_11229_cov_19.134142_2_plen_135_part_00
MRARVLADQQSCARMHPGVCLHAPDDWGGAHQSSRYRDHGVIRKSPDDGKSWPRSLVLTPYYYNATTHSFNQSVPGRFAYSNIMAEPLSDDPSMGAIAWDHHLPGVHCNPPPLPKRPAPKHCNIAMFTRFKLDF